MFQRPVSGEGSEGELSKVDEAYRIQVVTQ